MKHAYLIIAHNQFKLLGELLSLLDDKNNTLIVHMDKKASIEDFYRMVDVKQFRNLSVIQKVSVTWGGHSQIECELALLKEALSKNERYDYLHIISGVDLPIKSIGYINDFFEANNGKEFLYYDLEQNKDKILPRCNEYHLFQDVLGRKETGLLAGLEKLTISAQKKLNVSRVGSIESYLGKGANWVSITYDFAEFVVDHEKFIKQFFWYSRCADEVFMHTLLNMSPFKDNLFVPSSQDDLQYTNMVYTDWKRGNPYTFRDEDLPELVSLPYLFARKFDEKISVDKLKELIG